MNLSFQNFSKIISHPTWDILVFLFFIAAGFFYGTSQGKRGLIGTLFAIYIGQIIFTKFSYLDFLLKGKPLLQIFSLKAAIFLILVIVLAILFSKLISESRYAEKGWGKIFLLSFLESGLLISSLFQLFPIKGLFTFSSLTQFLFASPVAYFWWLVLPIPALIFIVRK